MHAQTRPRFLLSSERVLGKGVRTHVKSNGKIPSTGGSEEGPRPNPRRSITYDSETSTLPTELFRPPSRNKDQRKSEKQRRTRIGVKERRRGGGGADK